MSKPTREEINRENAEGKSKFKRTLDFFYPPNLAKQDAEDDARCGECDELPDDCQC